MNFWVIDWLMLLLECRVILKVLLLAWWLLLLNYYPQLQEYLGIPWDLCIRPNITTKFIPILNLLVNIYYSFLGIIPKVKLNAKRCCSIFFTWTTCWRFWKIGSNVVSKYISAYWRLAIHYSQLVNLRCWLLQLMSVILQCVIVLSTWKIL